MNKVDAQKFRHLTPGANERMCFQQKKKKKLWVGQSKEMYVSFLKTTEESVPAQILREGQVPAITVGGETKENSLADCRSQENSFMMTTDENNP